VIIFGWGRRTFHHAGAVLFQRCPHCSNTGWFYLVTVRRWFTLFFIPVIPYEHHHMLLCPTCNRGVRLAGAELKRAKSLIQLAELYTANAINGPEYLRRLQESGITPSAGAQPAPLTLAAAPTAASDGFGGIQLATQPAAPPMPSATPPFRGTRMSRTAQVVRVLVPVLVIGLAAGLWIYTSQNNGSNAQTTTSSFQTGDCVTTPTGGTEIVSVSCNGAHDGRIDEVLNGSATFCPPGDTELAVLPPNPDLCVDFNDHSP
jgi:hypothetical protein